jgi:hypothetical protein
MQLHRPLPHLGDLGIVDLDFVDSVGRYRARDEQYQSEQQVAEIKAHLTNIKTRGPTLCCFEKKGWWLRRSNT